MTPSSASGKIADALADLDEDKLLNLLREQLVAGEDPLALLEACRKGMVLSERDLRRWSTF
nr:hypothetical protein [Candidatus Njordarchaeum guaymaensis]